MAQEPGSGPDGARWRLTSRLRLEEAEAIHLRMPELIRTSDLRIARGGSFVLESRIEHRHHEAERAAFDLATSAHPVGGFHVAGCLV